MFTRKTRVISAIATICMLISMMACIATPAYAEVDPSTYPSVQTVTAAITPTVTTNYSVNSVADWQYLESKIDWFNDDDIVIHLTTDLDMSSSSFLVMDDPYFSFDGHNHIFKNWGKSGAPVRSNGIFRYNSNEGRMKFIKNLIIDNCHTKYNDGAGGYSAMLVSFEGGNSGQLNAAPVFTIENVHIKNSSVQGIGNGNSIFISGYATKSWDYTLNMKNCSLINNKLIPTVYATGKGHNGLLIGKLSDNDNGKNGTVNISNIYVEGNTYNASRQDSAYYDTMLIGNVEGGNVKVTLSNIYLGNNTANYYSPVIGYLMNAASGRGGTTVAAAQNPTIKGVVIQDNTLNTTATEAQRGVLTVMNNGTGTLSDVYTNDTKVTVNGAFLGGAGSSTPLTAKVGDSYMTSGEAAYALNKNATADSAFWYTTTAAGVELGTAANATRKVTVQLANGTQLSTIYLNGGDSVAIKYPAIVKEGNATIANNVLTMGNSGDVVVQVELTPEEYEEYQKEVQKSVLKETIDYFEARNPNYYVAQAATALANAKSVYESASSNIEDYTTANNALEAYKTQLVDTYPNVPSISEMGSYPAVKNYKIMNADELVVADVKTALYADGITLHLGANITMTGKSFNGFDGSSANFDGHNFTITDWDHNSTVGFFANYKGGTIKDVTFDGCNIVGGYGRALICGNDIKGDTVMTNVHVKNCSVAEGTNDNLGGIFCGRVNGAYTLEVKNCSVVNTEIKTNLTGGDAGFTNSGVVAGRVAHGATYKVENLFVDGFQNNAFPDTTQSKSNGILFGNTEGAATVTVKDVVVINSGGTHASVLYEWATATPSISVENLIAVNNNSPAFMSGYATQMAADKLSLVNCYTDETVKALVFVSGTNTISERINTFNGISSLSAVDVTGGKAAHIANNFGFDGKFIFTNDNGIKLGNETNATRKITLVDASGVVVNEFYRSVGAKIDVASDEFDSYALKAGSAGTIDGSVVTVSENKDVTVVVSLSEQGVLIQAKKLLQQAVNYFKVERVLSYFNSTVATAVAEAGVLLETTDLTKVQEIKDKAAALNALKTGNYAGTKENAPGFSEADLYPNAPLYVIRKAADFDALEAKKGNFTDADTIYMVNDIDMKGSTFNGIRDFKASFDGQGYTIKNWGIAADGTKKPISTQGLFYNGDQGTAFVKSIKNVTMENCHTTTGATYSAMLYGVGHGNAGLTDGATKVDLINNHFIDCSIKVTSGRECIAFLLSRYAISGKDAVVNVINCSVIDSVIDGSTATHVDDDGTKYMGHASTLIGKARASGNTANTAIYNLKDCLVSGNTIKSPRVNADYEGLVIGTIEQTGGGTERTRVNMTNVGVFNNTFNNVGGATQTNLIADAQGSIVTVKGLLVSGNIATGANAQTVVLFNKGKNTTLENAYCDSNLSSVTTNGSATLTGTTVGSEAAWKLNNQYGENLWWTTVDGAVVKGTKDNATRKVEFRNQAAGANDLLATFYTEGNGTLPNTKEVADLLNSGEFDWLIEGQPLDPNQAYTKDTVVYSIIEHNFEGGKVEAMENLMHKVLCTDEGCHGFRIEGCSASTYTHKVVGGVDQHDSYCACGNFIKTFNCDLKYTKGEGVHKEWCDICGYTAENVGCEYGINSVHVSGKEGADSQHTGSCACGNIGTEACYFFKEEIFATSADSYDVAEYTCQYCDYFYREVLGGAKLLIEANNVRPDEEIKVVIKLDAGKYGVNSMIFELNYDPRLTLKSGVSLDYLDTITINDDQAGKITVTASNYENVTGEADVIELIFEPINAETTLHFEVLVDAFMLDAQENSLRVKMDCSEKIIESYEQVLLGDVNNDGLIDIMDVVPVLRVINGNLNVDMINKEAANIYTEDGYTDNYGINTKDAIMILRKALENF